MIVVERRWALVAALPALHERGTLALVPTMGYLHEGHVSLVREAKRRADQVAVWIFVNPAQFGPSEDLARYPRSLPADLAKCQAAGADLVYAPSDVSEVYGEGHQTWVEVEGVSRGLCGERRPGHFRGVATVVAKMFSLFRPDVALFGEKDYQQLAVIRRMVRDLDMDGWLEIVGMPTVREADGLAMSSRNSYLSAADRTRATSIHRGLGAAKALYDAGERDGARLVAAAREKLDVDQVDYVELVDADALTPVVRADRAVCLLVAAFLGKTRLIDNQVLGR